MISGRIADKITQTLCGRYGLVLTYKTGPLWAAVGATLDVVRAFGAMVPGGKEFNERFATTLGTLVALPDAHLSPEELIPLLVHETTHAKQFVLDHVRFVVQYLQHREKRATWEAEAYGQQAALLWLMTGALPSRVEDMAHALPWGYALTPEDCALAYGLLEQYATSIVAGVLPEGPCWVAASILARECPEALNADALALVRANCPQALGAA